MAGLAAAAGAPGGDLSHRRKPALGAWLVLAPLLAWLILFVVIPTIMLVVVSFATRDSLGRVVYDFSFANYERAFQWTWLRVFLQSIWYAFLTTVICVVVGYPVAYFIGRAPPRWRMILLMLVMIPFWTSFLIRTYAWLAILSRDGLLNGLLVASGIFAEPVQFLYTPFAIVLGLVYNFLPFMILPIYTSVEKLDGAMVEAAYDLGAGPVRAFSQVIIPLTRPGIVAGALLVFVPAIAMFAITTLMGGGSNPTIGEVIYRQFTSGRNQPFGAALGSLLLLVFVIALWLTRRQREDPG
ncbi:MAG: ABC transporter permease [Terrimicrobiaceae bacterium]|nr:ABC transporter permease [Terrimicrobiaceae bacterium]